MQQFVQQAQVCVAVSGNRLPQPSSRGAFVINLGSSSTPVALSSPEDPELKKFTFFVSRRREDGRERFRLHMGYFETQQDAEQLLAIVREVYPGAWAGIAPGRKAPEALPVPPPAVAVTVPDATPPLPSAPAPATEIQLELEPAPPQKQEEHFAAEQSLSSVRAAIASLDDRSAAGAVAASTTLSSQQTLTLLESTASTPVRPVPPPVLRTPDSAAAFAVQLRWSNQPIGLSELPPLAIFDAYTLYRAKGRHDGRHWHALRLGFFNDQVSADQVASYIRPEFTEATVVAVGIAERDGAMAASTPRPQASAQPGQSGAKDRSSGLTGQFRLIEDGVRASAEPNHLEMMLTTDVAAKPAARAGQSAAESKDQARTRRPPANLEETLDVLGAGNLKLDSGKGEMLDASGMRRMRHAAERKPQARSSLSRLFERLAESIGGGR